MKNIGKLVDAICAAYKLASKPGGAFAPNLVTPARADQSPYLLTHCNEAFNFVALRMGYDRFDRRDTRHPTDAELANAIFAHMKDPAGLWHQIDPKTAQRLANEGALVAAIDGNLDGPGHVCVVMPGEMEHSGTFGELVPRVLDIGKKVQLSVKASFAFQVKDKPLYFCLKEDFIPAAVS